MPDYRKLIAKNDIDGAITALLALDCKFSDDISLLSSQYKEWYHQFVMGNHPPEYERNRIVFALLYIITEIEKESASGLKRKRLDFISNTELSLALSNKKLGILKKEGPIDVFMKWFIAEDFNAFRKLANEEKHNNGKSISLSFILANLEYETLLGITSFWKTPDDVKSYIYHQSRVIEYLFSGWQKYDDYRSDYSDKLETAIQQDESNYKQLFKAGFLGVLGGVVSSYFMNSKVFQVMQEYETDMDDDISYDDLWDDD